MCATGHQAGCQVSLCPNSAPMPGSLPKNAHLGFAGASLGKRGDMFEVDKDLLADGVDASDICGSKHTFEHLSFVLWSAC